MLAVPLLKWRQDGPCDRDPPMTENIYNVILPRLGVFLSRLRRRQGRSSTTIIRDVAHSVLYYELSLAPILSLCQLIIIKNGHRKIILREHLMFIQRMSKITLLKLNPETAFEKV